MKERPEELCIEDLEAREPASEVESARRVLELGFSRNRHYEFYETPEGQVLRSFRRSIQGLLADLERAGPDEPIHYELDPGTGRVRVELYIPKYRAWRRCFFSELELEALKSHPRIGPRLLTRKAA